MKLLVVPDLHGRKESCFNAIKKFEEEDYSEIIFLGDYCDSYDRTTEDMLAVLKLVLDAKERWGDKVILLIGNHELHYLYDDERYLCSGFSAARKTVIQPVLRANQGLFKVAYQKNKGNKRYLFTHAGVCKRWLEQNEDVIKDFNKRYRDELTDDNLADYLNRVNQTSYGYFLHQVGIDRGGIYPVGGITWCDFREMMQFNPIKGFHQIVGHTPQRFTRRFDKFNEVTHDDTSVTFCDVLGEDMNNFFELEI